VELRSFRLGLVGRADVVEFHRMPGTDGADHWRPFPVEYKRGRPKKGEWDRIQLCAQAMCLEEMLQVEVPAGALFYGKRRRRLPVTFDKPMRARVEETANRLHDLVASGRTPPPEFGPHCEACSLVSFCMPKVVGKGAGWASAYVGALMYDD
jgi:CRISPR-associated exonuclease Cas4